MRLGPLEDYLGPEDTRSALRSLAGILIALGFALFFLRRGTQDVFGEATSEFALTIFLVAPTVFLLGVGLRSPGPKTGPGTAWRSVYTVLGTLLLPAAMFQLTDLVSDLSGAGLNAIIFGFAAQLSIAVWFEIEARFHLLVGSVFALIAYINVADLVLGDLGENLGGLRWALLLFAVGLAFLAFRMRDEPLDDPDAASAELLTGAGIATIVLTFLGLVGGFVGLILSASPIPLFAGVPDSIPEPSVFWDLVALSVGLALIVGSLELDRRGPAYAGAAVLALFLVSVGFDLDDDSPEGEVVGWPLLIAAAGVLLYVYAERVLGRAGHEGPAVPPTRPQGPPPGAPPPGPPQGPPGSGQ